MKNLLEWIMAAPAYYLTWEYYRNRISKTDLHVAWIVILGSFLLVDFDWFTLAVLGLWIWSLAAYLKRSRVG